MRNRTPSIKCTFGCCPTVGNEGDRGRLPRDESILTVSASWLILEPVSRWIACLLFSSCDRISWSFVGFDGMPHCVGMDSSTNVKVSNASQY